MGSKHHDAATKEEFRALYLLSGNAEKSAKELGVAPRTGGEWAKKCNNDPEFAAERRELRAGFLDELIFMRQRVARKAEERVMCEAPIEPGCFDKRPDWAKVVLDAEKNAHSLAKAEGPVDNDDKTPVVINVHGPKAAE